MHAASGSLVSSEIRTLAALPFRAIISTSYSDGFERALADLDRAMPVFTPADAGAFTEAMAEPFLFKALGDPARPETLVWTADDVVATLGRGGYRSAAQDLFRRMSFVFIGFAAGDPDLRILLDRVRSHVSPRALAEGTRTGRGAGRLEARTRSARAPDRHRSRRERARQVSPHAGAERLRVWSALGVTLTHLGDMPGAIDAFEVAVKLEPTRRSRREQLASMYEDEGMLERAIAQHQQLLAAEPTRLDSYRALERLFVRTGSLDRAQMARAALSQRPSCLAGIRRGRYRPSTGASFATRARTRASRSSSRSWFPRSPPSGWRQSTRSG